MKTRVSRTVSACFAILRQIRSIRRLVSQQVLQSLVVSLVLRHLDYGSATLAGLPSNQLHKLQSVMPVHDLYVRHASSNTSRCCSECHSRLSSRLPLPTWYSSAVPGMRAVLCGKQ